jgi:putative membrane protein
MHFLLNWLIYTLAIIITAYILPGVEVEGIFAALVAALVLGLINAALKPIIFIITLPINILTLGLFTLVINALLVMLADLIVPGFSVSSFLWALLFSVILSIVNLVLIQIKE